MLLIEFGVVSSILGANKIGVRTIVGKAATDNLFYLTLVQVDTGTKRGQRIELRIWLRGRQYNLLQCDSYL